MLFSITLALDLKIYCIKQLVVYGKGIAFSCRIQQMIGRSTSTVHVRVFSFYIPFCIVSVTKKSAS